jgi:hypothetical protein
VQELVLGQVLGQASVEEEEWVQELEPVPARALELAPEQVQGLELDWVLESEQVLA